MIFLLVVLKCVTISVVSRVVVILSLDPWLFTVLTLNSNILDTIDVFLLKSVDTRAGTANPGRLGYICLNICLLLDHHSCQASRDKNCLLLPYQSFLVALIKWVDLSPGNPVDTLW